jgi:hypothetical protein
MVSNRELFLNQQEQDYEQHLSNTTGLPFNHK